MGVWSPNRPILAEYRGTDRRELCPLNSQEPTFPGAVAFKRMADVAGLDNDPSGHSSRIGAAQDMTAAGLGNAEIQQAGRWKSATMVSRYTENQQVRRLSAVGGDPGAGLFAGDRQEYPQAIEIEPRAGEVVLCPAQRGIHRLISAVRT